MADETNAGTSKVFLTGAERGTLIRAMRKREAGMRDAQARAAAVQNEFAAVVDSILEKYDLQAEVASIETSTGELILKLPTPVPKPA
jgi:adenylosuccinate lyase